MGMNGEKKFPKKKGKKIMHPILWPFWNFPVRFETSRSKLPPIFSFPDGIEPILYPDRESRKFPICLETTDEVTKKLSENIKFFSYII